ncbi:MAG: hypothetical protein CM15mP55_3330 [Hyphomicrobiales bacterium]|nr:MAG: hypothetical protein CM15mP55_3330 [Hyphomicrobiales bacterium]
MLRPLYDAVLRLSAHRRASWVLGAVSFIESSVFPVPPDLLLVPMIFSARRVLGHWRQSPRSHRRWVRCWDMPSAPCSGTHSAAKLFSSMAGKRRLTVFRHFMSNGGCWSCWPRRLLFCRSKSPPLPAALPACHCSVFVTSLVGRGLRFYLVAAGAYYLGPSMRRQFERNFARMSAVTGVLHWLCLSIFSCGIRKSGPMQTDFRTHALIITWRHGHIGNRVYKRFGAGCPLRACLQQRWPLIALPLRHLSGGAHRAPFPGGCWPRGLFSLGRFGGFTCRRGKTGFGPGLRLGGGGWDLKPQPIC